MVLVTYYWLLTGVPAFLTAALLQVDIDVQLHWLLTALPIPLSAALRSYQLISVLSALLITALLFLLRPDWLLLAQSVLLPPACFFLLFHCIEHIHQIFLLHLGRSLFPITTMSKMFILSG